MGRVHRRDRARRAHAAGPAGEPALPASDLLCTNRRLALLAALMPALFAVSRNDPSLVMVVQGEAVRGSIDYTWWAYESSGPTARLSEAAATHSQTELTSVGPRKSGQRCCSDFTPHAAGAHVTLSGARRDLHLATSE